MKFLTTLFLVFASCSCIFLFCAAAAQQKPNDESDLAKRVEKLEAQVTALKRTMHDLHLSAKLTGHWVEVSWVRAGERIDQSEDELGIGFGGPVEWRLGTDVNSQRWLLCAEPKSDAIGYFTLDTTKSPVWIDFHHDYEGRKTTTRGIIKSSYGEMHIALPMARNETIISDAARPTSFESTAENGYSVYHLKRDSYKRTGVF